MVYRALTALLALLASARASFTLPADLPNALYEVTYDQNGALIHNLITRSEDAVAPRQACHEKRDYGVFCAQAILPTNNILQAQNALGGGCDSNGNTFIDGWTEDSPGIRYAKFDTVVAYVCHYSKNRQGCSSDEIYNDFAAIQGQCSNVAGKSPSFQTACVSRMSFTDEHQAGSRTTTTGGKPTGTMMLQERSVSKVIERNRRWL